jgi:hypothetical protein
MPFYTVIGAFFISNYRVQSTGLPIDPDDSGVQVGAAPPAPQGAKSGSIGR